MATRRLMGAVPRHLRSMMIRPTSPSLSSQTPIMRLSNPFFRYTQVNTFTAPSSTDPLSLSDLRLLSTRKKNYMGSEVGPNLVALSGKSEAEKVKEAVEIGYVVAGPLTASENPFKQYEPAFAVVQIGSHQFKVSNGDSIFTERLKYCEVNDKLILSKVLMLGSRTETIIGRPILPDAAVHAVVEEHALDAKVLIFKKKRRKNYRRTKGHRQELTKLRITDIQGIDKSERLTVAA